MMPSKILKIIEDYRPRMIAYRDLMAEHLAHVISESDKIIDNPKLKTEPEDEGPLIKHPRFGFDQTMRMVEEIKMCNTYIEKMHEIEKKLLSEKLDQYPTTDYMTLRHVEEFLGITPPRREKLIQ